jgi:FMN-dependent oxidoreductase (nitrilotriacetate monooxygenase family)
MDHNDIDAWIALAVALEQARFDFLFFADATGVPSVYQGSSDPAVSEGIGVPLNDPSVLMSALGAATTDLGLTFSSATLQEHPFNLARKLSTLDHLTRGRIGWNIVTGYSDSAARNFGLGTLLSHDERYEQAHEYLEVTYKLWEASWDEHAVTDDARLRRYADPAGVRPIAHHGRYYDVGGPHMCEPSPQRTPLLLQAGASRAGREFAARHAEGVFLIAPNLDAARAYAADIRGRAAAYGRSPSDLFFLQGAWFVVGDTAAQARRRERELFKAASPEGLLVDLSAKLGLDLGTVDLDATLDELDVPGVRGIIEQLKRAGDSRATVRAALPRLLSARFTGTAGDIADELERWHDAGIDGINVMDAPSHSAFADFAEHLAPVLQQRGLMQDHYAPGTLRQKIFGAGSQLPTAHPARGFAGCSP